MLVSVRVTNRLYSEIRYNLWKNSRTFLDLISAHFHLYLNCCLKVLLMHWLLPKSLRNFIKFMNGFAWETSQDCSYFCCDKRLDLPACFSFVYTDMQDYSRHTKSYALTLPEFGTGFASPHPSVCKLTSSGINPTYVKKGTLAIYFFSQVSSASFISAFAFWPDQNLWIVFIL